jgi:hypothetical protein
MISSPLHARCFSRQYEIKAANLGRQEPDDLLLVRPATLLRHVTLTKVSLPFDFRVPRQNAIAFAGGHAALVKGVKARRVIHAGISPPCPNGPNSIRTFNAWRFPATLGTISKIHKIRNTQLIQIIAPIFKQRRFQKLSLKITTKYGGRNDKRGSFIH